MAALLSAIKFRSLLSDFSQIEKTKFMKKLLSNGHTELVIESLFTYFIQSSKDSNDNITSDADNVISILAEIIQQRKKKREKQINFELSRMPKAIIGHAASFMEQSDYAQFEATNRFIYLGCNEPNKLQALNLGNCDIGHYPHIHLSRFHCVKKLRVNMRGLYSLRFPHHGQTALKKLRLDASKVLNVTHVHKHINHINLPNVENLHLFQFGDLLNNQRGFNIDTLWKILDKFASCDIKKVSLDNCSFSANIDPLRLKKLFPNISALRFNGGNLVMNDGLINEFANNLEYLFMIYSSTHSTLNYAALNFSKLNQLVLTAPTKNLIIDIIKTAQSLQKIFLDFAYENLSLSKAELKVAFSAVLKIESLNFLHVESNVKDAISILDGIEYGLFETKKMKRKQLKVRMNLRAKDMFDPKDLVIKVTQIVHMLECFKVDDFMFILDLELSRQSRLEEAVILEELNEISRNVIVRVNDLCFVISKKDCKICGSNEKWIMDIC